MIAEDEIRIRHIPLYDVCADHTFDSPIANRRMGHLMPDTLRERLRRPRDVHAVVDAYMAGMRCPTPQRFTDLVHDISDIEDWERAAVRELFGQLSPAECSEFMLSTDGSPREVARLMRESGVRRGLVVNWVNQYSSDPDWHEDKALPIWWGDLWVNEGGRVVPRHD
ncbi:MAG: hypothetical protein J4F45_04175 [Pseudomonadales bacterium]|nr:hypothetical protein [Pseudomonadales bacterium]